MKLTKTSALAALATAYLSRQSADSVVQARQVAQHLGIPTDSALKILQTLARHRVIESRLGRGGGYRLGKPAREVSLLQIIEAIDGPLRSSVCLSAHDGVDPRSLDVLESLCGQITHHVRQELAHTTIDRIVAPPEVISPQTPAAEISSTPVAPAQAAPALAPAVVTTTVTAAPLTHAA